MPRGSSSEAVPRVQRRSLETVLWDASGRPGPRVILHRMEATMLRRYFAKCATVWVRSHDCSQLRVQYLSDYLL